MRGIPELQPDGAFVRPSGLCYDFFTTSSLDTVTATSPGRYRPQPAVRTRCTGVGVARQPSAAAF